MEKENARKQTLEQLHERRKQEVRLHKKGIGIMRIVDMTGLSYPAVRTSIDLFVAGGWAAIRPALRGRRSGTGRTLTQAQEDSIQRIIIDNRPEQLKMDFFLWSRAAVGHLSPIDALKNWQQKMPDIFTKKAYNQAELDSWPMLLIVAPSFVKLRWL